MFYIKKRPALFKRGESERRKEMQKQYSYRVLSFILALLLLAAAVPTALFASADEFVPENAFLTKLKSAEGILMGAADKSVSVNSRFDGNGALAASTDGDTQTAVDVYGALDWNPPKYVGAKYSLTEAVYAGEIKIYSGFDAYTETYDVYASENEGDLFEIVNRVGSGIVCGDNAKVIPVNKKVKYVAFVCTAYNGNMRVKEFELWTGDESSVPGEFVSKNILALDTESAVGVLMNKSTAAVTANTKFDENGAIAAATDGDRTVHTDVYGWDADNMVGVLYTLNDTYYCGSAVIYSGLNGYPDSWTVYASDSLESLYNDENRYAYSVTVENNSVIVDVNANVRYIAFFTGNGARVKELELWTAENPDKPFVSENAFVTTLESSSGILMDAADGTVSENNRFDGNGALSASVDGDTATAVDVYGALDWNPPKYVGAKYVLTEAVYAGEIRIYSGFDNLTETYDVYASENEGDLFEVANRVGSGIVCGDDAKVIPVNKKVKYVAFVCTAYNGNMRVKEFELWTSEDTGEPVIPTEPVKILTVGNSFAENASVYAAEIAAAQGYGLTFGYLKYPSCTIEQHYNNAVNNQSVYKFEVTSLENGSVVKNTVKDGIKTFAAVKEALDYTDWDVIAIQQGSTASYNYSTYEKADDLVAYIKESCPDAEIVLHETWSWATWAEDSSKENNFKHIEDCYHKLAEELGGVRIIPTGRAFEFARKEGISVNDTDNQHANSYGMYLAGACYTAVLFGADILKNPFGTDHPAFADVDMDTLRSAVMNAVRFDYDPDTNWDWADDKKDDEDSDLSDPDSANFIKRHLNSYSSVTQDIATGAFAENNRFEAANANASKLAIDGDITNYFEVWGALDWEYPNNVGILYKLDGLYNVDNIVIYAGLENQSTKFDVYVSDSAGTVYSESNRIAHNVECTSQKVEVPVNKEISCVVFVITDYTGSAHITEFDMTGLDKKIEIKPIVWPAVPDSGNILADAEASKIIAPGGDYMGSKKFEYKLMDGQTETDLSVLTDGKIDMHYDVWSLTENDRPGVLYDLGAYYDITHLHAWAGAFDSEIIINNGYKIYASENLADLFKTENLVFDYTNQRDTTNEAGAKVSLSRIRYVAFLLTRSSDGGWRMREFAAYGTKSADQTEAVEPTSIIEGIEAEYYGVATDNLADPIYMGASNFIAALTDGSRDAVEFWGGSDVGNTSFVFIYNLYANYDLTGIDIYALADSIEEDSGIHKGIRSARVYAARKFNDLFTGNPLVMKEDYTNPAAADENSYYSADALTEWKGVRYIAYVFTIGDTRYGACRLEELKAFGAMSAVQDPEEEEVKLPQYIDIKAENGVVARIFALNSSDDLSKLGAVLASERSDDKAKLDEINAALSGYKAHSLYSVTINDASGNRIDTGGRIIRLSIPESEEGIKIACVDDFGAEIVSSSTLGKFVTVETETLRSYAVVSESDAVSADAAGKLSGLWIAVIVLGALALASVACVAVVAVKTRR